MHTLHLPAELTIYAVAELHPQWLAWAQHAAGPDGPPTVDGSAVEQVDGAGLQLLVALQHSLAGSGQPLRLTGASDALRDACAALGLAGWLAGLQAATPEAA